MNADPNPDRLRQILRQGDPAAGDPGLSPDEIHAMRRAVLTAAPEARRRFAWLPALATGAAALLVLALAVALEPWRRPPVPGSSAPAPVQMAAAPTPSAAPAVPSEPTPGSVKVAEPAHRHPVRAVRVARALKALPERHQDDAPLLTASLPVREIQFSTPGGTRVIWELSGQDVR